jgi:eukaryotic-like serine/threonine-protein kinase
MRWLSAALFLVVFIQAGAQQAAKQYIRDFREKPIVHWKFTISAPVISSPVVSDNLVYFGGLDSVFHALDIRSGKVAWKLKTKGQIRSTALIAGDHLYLNGGDGSLYCLDKRTGKVKWTFASKGEKKYDFADYHQSSPMRYNDIVYFGSGDGNVYAVRSDNGSKLWNYQTGDMVHTTPVIDNNKLFAGSFDGYVYALDATSGSLLWKFKTVGHRFFPRGEVQGSPAVFKGLVFIGARDYNVYALDQNKGYCHWNKSFTRGWGLVNTIHDSILHIGSADERVLIAAEPETGKEHWKKPMEFLVFGSNAYSESMFYVGTTIGKLHGIDARTGEKVWSVTTNGYQQNRLKYFKEDDTYRDDIYSIIKSNEHFLEVEYALGGIFSTPAITNDFLVFTSTEGAVYCLKR